MMQEIVVFLGPSLPVDTARGILDALYLPPARRGDLLLAGSQGAGTIVLIDGVFFQDCAVAHREVLAVIHEGVRVVGASSMGALRAAELDTLGMEGVGEVYRLYRDGVLTSDDEVALTFDPLTYAPLSEPLVNIRATIAVAEESGVLTRDDGACIFLEAQRRYFPDRRWEDILESLKGSIPHYVLERFRIFLISGVRDVKAEDAVLALTTVRNRVREPGS